MAKFTAPRVEMKETEQCLAKVFKIRIGPPDRWDVAPLTMNPLVGIRFSRRTINRNRFTRRDRQAFVGYGTEGFGVSSLKTPGDCSNDCLPRTPSLGKHANGTNNFSTLLSSTVQSKCWHGLSNTKHRSQPRAHSSPSLTLSISYPLPSPAS